ncbi:MAG: hypothetical protein ACREQ9_04070, partial [Candidatus Binatia bacterium]
HPPRRLRGVVWLGADAPPAVLPGWRRRWLSIPEASVFAAIECGKGSFHLDPDLIVETERGRLLVTMLAGDSPVLRADTGLDGRVVAGACACGDPASAIRLVAAEPPVPI